MAEDTGISATVLVSKDKGTYTVRVTNMGKQPAVFDEIFAATGKKYGVPGWTRVRIRSQEPGSPEYEVTPSILFMISDWITLPSKTMRSLKGGEVASYKFDLKRLTTMLKNDGAWKHGERVEFSIRISIPTDDMFKTRKEAVSEWIKN